MRTISPVIERMFQRHHRRLRCTDRRRDGIAEFTDNILARASRHVFIVARSGGRPSSVQRLATR